MDALASRLSSSGLPRALLVALAREAIQEARTDGGDAETIARGAAAAVARTRPRRVVNATGVLLHTNLGRAPIGASAAGAAAEAATAPTPLEFDLATGSRGGRGAYVHRLVRVVTGAEAALVVNNNAGALLLTLAALAGGREVVVSRGELIEIGGSFRLPDLMAASGAHLVEVGTTNRTRIADYRKACGPATALLLKVHPSNYRVEGFTEEVGYGALAALATEVAVPFVADIGSGLLDARAPWLEGPPPVWLAAEPAARQTLEAGAGLVMFSGDKLLGGPQAGILAGNADLIARLRSHPIARAVRIDGARLAAAAATLEAYANGTAGGLPFWRMASLTDADLRPRCRALADAVGGEVVAGLSLPGAGSAPGVGIPGPIVTVRTPRSAWRTLLAADPPIVARYEDDRLLIDLRSVEPGDDTHLGAAVAAACRS